MDDCQQDRTMDAGLCNTFTGHLNIKELKVINDITRFNNNSQMIIQMIIQIPGETSKFLYILRKLPSFDSSNRPFWVDPPTTCILHLFQVVNSTATMDTPSTTLEESTEEEAGGEQKRLLLKEQDWQPAEFLP